jgi:hypothetical protein
MDMQTQSQLTQTVSGKPGARGPRFARRTLIAAAASAGVCGAAVVASPYIVPYVEERLKEAALASALDELRQIEGISLEAAIRAAELTRAAVSLIVLPVAQLVAMLGSSALNALLVALDAAHNALSFIHVSTVPLDALHTVVASWQTGITALPITLDAYLNTDITSAESYLRALERMMAQHTSTTGG